MDLLHGRGDRFIVVDVETTGVYDKDRIVEVAAVTLSPRGRIVDEWDTLVNPERDVGPTHLHRISASMVSAAPTFLEVAAALAERLHGALVVAHNLTFDARMLVNEYARCGGSLDPGRGICTLQVSGEKLTDACRRNSIPLTHPHRALADVRATARLLRFCLDSLPGRGFDPASVAMEAPEFRPRTLRRDITGEPDEEMPYLARLADRAHHYGQHGAALVYMDLLDWVISDLVITPTEHAQLLELAMDLGLSADEVSAIHERYLSDLLEAARRDGVIDAHERAYLDAAARELGVDDSGITEAVSVEAHQPQSYILEPGMRVCFTGVATTPGGSELKRSILEGIAEDLGLLLVSAVTKKGCDVLVAADVVSQSGKARQAGKYGIPIISVAEFLDQYDAVRAEQEERPH